MKSQRFVGNITLVCFMVAQLVDWFATYQGVTLFGTEIEANPVLRFLMERYDIILSLTAAKIAATAAGVFLHLFDRHFEVAFLTLVYSWFALVPWFRALTLHPIF